MRLDEANTMVSKSLLYHFVTGRFRRDRPEQPLLEQPILSPLPLTQIRYPEAGQSSAFTSVAPLLRYGGNGVDTGLEIK